MIAWGGEYTDCMSTPCLLAFDTATEQMSVAVIVGEGDFCAQELGGARASQRLLPLVFELLHAAGLPAARLDAVAFGRGPGAFTGLRTATSVAQGLALGIGCPVLPLDSLMIIAEDARERHGANELWVVMDARMDEVYAGAYRFENDRWQVQHEPALFTLPALQALWQADAPQAVAGSALAAFGERLRCGGARRIDEAGTDRANVEPRAGRAGALARLARAAWLHDEAIDAAQALPLYLRDKVALTIAERVAALAPATS
jgi:tRNA threonylcarbamoyladenosine biosynthesis protein TsaB